MSEKKYMQLTMYGTEEKLSVIPKKPKTYCETVRESIEYYSLETSDLQSLLAVLIGTKATPELCGKLATLPMKQLVSMSIADFKAFGLSKVAASQLVAGFGLARKVAMRMDMEQDKVVIRSPDDVAKLMMPKLRHVNQEHFVCLFLNTKNQVIGEETIFIGSLNSSIVHPREIFHRAVKRSCASIICVHQHPSGDPNPSREDVEVTKRLIQCGLMMGIEILDHIIIGDGSWVSLKEKGLI